MNSNAYFQLTHDEITKPASTEMLPKLLQQLGDGQATLPKACCTQACCIGPLLNAALELRISGRNWGSEDLDLVHSRKEM